tara:strand:- start:1681 stop:2412 length:732 start_codon:yes stop_codon:yes gene_type:complete
MKILVIGESCIDIFQYGTSVRLCPEAPVPVFNSIEQSEIGGMAKNVYNNISALGASVELHTNPNWKNITKTRIVDKRTNHMFLRIDVNDGDYGTCSLSDIDFSKYDAVVVSDYNKGFITTKDLKEISESHALTFLDTKKDFGPWAHNFTFIKINNSEYEKNKKNINDQIRERLIVTQGPNGCVYQGKNYEVPLVEIKDTSGAGDTFISALCVQYCREENIHKAIEFANKCATTVVQKRGVSVI